MAKWLNFMNEDTEQHICLDMVRRIEEIGNRITVHYKNGDKDVFKCLVWQTLATVKSPVLTYARDIDEIEQQNSSLTSAIS